MVTRSCSQQMFLLLPTRFANRVFQYCLAYAAQRTNVLIHAICVMSNHYHLVLTDPEARLPEFERILNKLVASCLNVHYGRGENFFAGGVQPSYVTLETPESMLDKVVYTTCNPVAAGLVNQTANWPGVMLWRPRTYKTRRPSVYFSETGDMPETIPLEVTPVPFAGVAGRREYEELVGLAIVKRETALRLERKLAGKGFLGKDRVRSQKHTDTPSSLRFGGELSPKVAARNKWSRIEALQRIKSFVDDYRKIFRRWQAGERDVLFPYGVYKMRVVHSVAYAHP